MKHDIDQEKNEKHELDALQKYQKKVLKPFDYLKKVDDKHFRYEFVKAQAREILAYMRRLRVLDFKAWEGYLKDCIIRGDSFLYDFYLKYNEEDGTFSMDLERMKEELIMPDPVPEEDRQ